MKIESHILLLPLFFSLFSQTVFADKTIVISSAVFPPFTTHDNTGFEDRVIPEMYHRAGLKTDIRRLPGQRGLLMVEDGHMDSTFSRVKGVAKKFNNLVQLDEPTFSRDFVVFSKSKNITIENWNSLKPYSVAFINGWKILEWNVKEYKSLLMVKNPHQLFNLLANDRTDIIIYAKYSGLFLLDQMNIKDVSIVGKPLASKQMSIILNKKHSDLIPRLNQALRQMKQDGSYQKAFDDTIGLLNR